MKMMQQRKRTTSVNSLIKTFLTAIAVVTILLAGSVHVDAAEQTLIGKDRYPQGGMGSWRVGAGHLAGETIVMSGYQWQWIINHKVGIGLMGESAQFETPVNFTRGGEKYELKYNLTGVEFEMFPNSDGLFHRSCSIMIGGGSLDNERTSDRWSEKDVFFVVEPRTGIEMNVTKWMRVNGSFAWRFVSGVDSEVFSQKDMGGWTAMMTMKFGWF
jgi:hypothetical protein